MLNTSTWLGFGCFRLKLEMEWNFRYRIVLRRHHPTPAFYSSHSLLSRLWKTKLHRPWLHPKLLYLQIKKAVRSLTKSFQQEKSKSRAISLNVHYAMHYALSLTHPTWLPATSACVSDTQNKTKYSFCSHDAQRLWRKLEPASDLHKILGKHVSCSL